MGKMLWVFSAPFLEILSPDEGGGNFFLKKNMKNLNMWNNYFPINPWMQTCCFNNIKFITWFACKIVLIGIVIEFKSTEVQFAKHVCSEEKKVNYVDKDNHNK